MAWQAVRPCPNSKWYFHHAFWIWCTS
jgi:hypothetical protein